MAKKLYEEENIRDIACAIREKCGDESKTYKCCDMADAIRALAIAGGEYDIAVTANSDGTQTLAIVDASGSGGNSGGGGSAPAVIQSLNITANGTYTVPAGVDGYNPVTVNVPIPEIPDTPTSGAEDELVMRTLSTYTNNQVTSVGKRAFQECESLTSVSFSNVTSVSDYAFYGCTNLVSVNMPKLTTIGANAFRNCEALTAVKMPLVTSIGTYAFDGCESSVSIDLPLITQIPNGALGHCYALTALILRNNTVVSLLNSDHFVGTPIAQGTGYIYVPAALLNTYKANSGWSKYTSQFRALESYTVDGTITGELDPTKI